MTQIALEQSNALQSMSENTMMIQSETEKLTDIEQNK